jgi:hypothetical protein
MRTDIERFKAVFPKSEYEEETNRIVHYDIYGTPIATLFFARECIEEYFEGYRVDAGDFTNPNVESVWLSGKDAVEQLGGHESAFNDI